MSGGPRISFNAIDSALSSLKNCQSYINSGMDVATQVALDLVESFNDEEDINNMEKVMLEYAKMDRELNHYIKAFEETINQVHHLLSELFRAESCSSPHVLAAAHTIFLDSKEQSSIIVNYQYPFILLSMNTA
ncbi:PREDICTED: E3 SUMO-protein ligase NSE2-like isoform X1 [Sturnus vulgaris]|uniref:E3 SUMO-protein ligase NSE2-like isoform X1 n=1 Tax=Sturnus vulgaris TaxID=9172 RepID=UPI00071AA71F|nr:PREDICTED: E3 SUMO-protein ligase NSE2-like isoform X1 [Sturnus vulgaris]